MSLVRRHPVGLFLCLAFALSWLSLAINAMGTDATVPVLLYFALLVVVAIVVVIVTGPAQLSRTLERQAQPEAGK